MDESMYLDAEYESIRAVMNSRGHSGDMLPGKVVRFIPEERADRVCALDDRIQKIREHLPIIATGAVLLAFLIGLVV